MLKRMSVLLCGAGLVLLTSGAAYAQTTTTEKATAAMSDAEITSAVKTKLLADNLVGGFNIHVETDKGVVKLTGQVASAAEKAQAIKLARQTHGVKNVVNRLTIEKKEATGTSGKKNEGALAKGADKTEDTAKKVGEETKDVAKTGAEKTENATKTAAKAVTDESVTTAVKARLETDKVARNSAIDVDVKSRIVTISGSVPTAADKKRIGRLVAHTTGVKSVENKLTVK